MINMDTMKIKATKVEITRRKEDDLPGYKNDHKHYKKSYKKSDEKKDEIASRRRTPKNTEKEADENKKERSRQKARKIHGLSKRDRACVVHSKISQTMKDSSKASATKNLKKARNEKILASRH
ncbi:hypothetical protein Tco_0676183 [Tanacetum coccineum]